MSDKLASYIGLAQRAGAVLYGEDIIVENKSKVKIVLIDSSANEKYIARLKTRLADRNIYVIEGLKGALHRAEVNAVGISNDSLASAISAIVR